jgi:hypothetical protein
LSALQAVQASKATKNCPNHNKEILKIHLPKERMCSMRRSMVRMHSFFFSSRFFYFALTARSKKEKNRKN